MSRYAYLIDPYALTVEQVDMEGKDFHDIQRMIGCRTFTCAYLQDGNGLYCDDEGLLTLTPDTRFLALKWYPDPIAGKGLLVGPPDSEGNDQNPTITLEQARASVKFLQQEMVRGRRFLTTARTIIVGGA